MSASPFRTLGVPDEFVARLERSGIVEPTPIQAAVIGDALAGRDVVGRAPTGSGKTLAFGLPLLVHLPQAAKRRPTGLVLVPTRELAQQVADSLQPFARDRRRTVVAIYGGVGYGPQRRALDGGADLVVACPGRLEDLLNLSALTLADVTQVVIDEADRMADMGFLPVVRRLVAQTNQRRQVQLFSATFDGAVSKVSAELQQSPVRHEVGSATPDLTAVHHAFWRVDREDRVRHTAEVVQAMGSTMVFCRTRHGADRLAKQLDRAGVLAAPIHGGRSQSQRDRALRSFADGAVAALVATDVASRGVHVDAVAAVVHYDPPADAATYVHRSGRTARAGASGVVVSMVEPNTQQLVRELQRTIGITAAVEPASVAGLQRALVAFRRDLSPAAPGDATRRHLDHTTISNNSISNDSKGATMQGTVKFFDANRGFGFISRSQGEDLFVHVSNLHPDARGALADGQSVEFEVGPGRRGDEARNVRPA